MYEGDDISETVGNTQTEETLHQMCMKEMIFLRQLEKHTNRRDSSSDVYEGDDISETVGETHTNRRDSSSDVYEGDDISETVGRNTQTEETLHQMCMKEMIFLRQLEKHKQKRLSIRCV